MNFDFILKYLPWYIDAAILTVKVSFFGILFSLAVGVICSIVQYYKIPVIRRIVSVYIEISRNTPLLVQLFFLYFGLPKIGIVWSAEICAIVGLAFLGGSYMSESIRSGLESVEKSQIESAASLGMSKLLTMKEVIFPQAIAVSVPGVCANVIFLIKETSVVSGIALADLMYVTKDLIGLYYETLLNWLNTEIETLGKENFFHADYQATLASVYGDAANPDNLVVEGGKVE
ncbi:MAG: ABC transporter permease subunit [Acutalibacteraceae bacterium]|nr:ABC transporter permease subunit [Acutalibacteraceae bacterium]